MTVVRGPSRLRVGVVGLGLMGSLYARIAASLPEADLVGVTDLDGERAEAVAAEVGARAYRTCRNLLDREQVDAVVVATPDSAHTEVALAAIEARTAVFVEKPLATSVGEAEQIVAAARQAGVSLAVGHVLRFDPAYVRAWRAVRNGEIGDVVHCLAYRSTGESDGTRLAGRVSVVFYLGVHDIDALQWIVGARIVRVKAQAVRRRMEHLGLDDAVQALLQFDSGAIAMLQASWLRPDGPSAPTGAGLEVVGTLGMVRVTPYAPSVSLYRENEMISTNQAYLLETDLDGIVPGIYRDELSQFLLSTGGVGSPRCTGEEALAAVRVAAALEESATLGTEVRVK